MLIEFLLCYKVSNHPAHATAGQRNKDRNWKTQMAWIETIEEDEWSTDENSPLAKLHTKVVDPSTGKVDHIMSVHSLDPGSMSAHLMLYPQAMRGTTTLPNVDREMIALKVSQQNECHY